MLLFGYLEPRRPSAVGFAACRALRVSSPSRSETLSPVARTAVWRSVAAAVDRSGDFHRAVWCTDGSGSLTRSRQGIVLACRQVATLRVLFEGVGRSSTGNAGKEHCAIPDDEKFLRWSGTFPSICNIAMKASASSDGIKYWLTHVVETRQSPFVFHSATVRESQYSADEPAQCSSS
ncbi:hypothetical protein AcV7_009744 [Taiwanofungus camphoratus]|nr:hypothetical protein AcV7_009744 [Antrodia cinnamomea]